MTSGYGGGMSTHTKSAIVLLSGGLDSMVVARIAKHLGANEHILLLLDLTRLVNSSLRHTGIESPWG